MFVEWWHREQTEWRNGQWIDIALIMSSNLP